MALGKRLAGPIHLTDAAATIYTAPAYVPTTQRTRVRTIRLFNRHSAVLAVTISVGADATGTRLLDAYPLATKTPYVIHGPIYLAAGEIIQGLAGTTNLVTVEIDGEEGEV